MLDKLLLVVVPRKSITFLAVAVVGPCLLLLLIILVFEAACVSALAAKLLL